MRPRQVYDTVWLVGSGTDDAVLTDPHDCHTYLVWDGDGGILIDCGTGLGFDRWLESVSSVCDPSRLRGCLVTHYHADHAAGAARLRAYGIPVLGSPETSDALRVADEQRTQLARAREIGIYPPELTLASAEVQVVRDGDTVTSGATTVEVVATAGHCDGHLAFALRSADETVLFSGDCLFAGGRVSLQAIPDCRLDRYAASVAHLAGLSVDTLLPGHGAIVSTAAHLDIQRAADSFARLVPPPNILG